MRTPRNPGIYCRLSYAPDGSLEKVERQEADARQVIDRLGWPQPPRQHVYSDNSRSAWQRNRKRPEWDRMLRDIEAGVVDGVVVYHGDRLVRQPWDLELLLKLAEDKRLPLASVTGTRDLSNPDDQFVLRIEVAQACRESANTSRRVKRSWRARVESGTAVGGGHRPFGYGVPTGRTGRTGKPIYDTTKVVEEEAAVLREAVDRLLSGEAMGSVFRWVRQVSRTTTGGEWEIRTFRNVLLRPRIAGLVEHEGKLYPAAWPGIISVEQWEDLRSLIQSRGKTWPQQDRNRKHLLSGVAECGSCGSKLRNKPMHKRGRVYYCAEIGKCPNKVLRSAKYLDAYVRGRVVRLLNDPRFLDELDVAQADPSLGAEIATLERRRAEVLSQLENLADHPDVSPEMIARALTSFDRKIAELRERIETTAEQRLARRMAGITLEDFMREPIEVQTATVRALYRIVVLPIGKRGPGFDPSSVRMIRRKLQEGVTS